MQIRNDKDAPENCSPEASFAMRLEQFLNRAEHVAGLVGGQLRLNPVNQRIDLGVRKIDSDYGFNGFYGIAHKLGRELLIGFNAGYDLFDFSLDIH